jgi:hypothetical protein
VGPDLKKLRADLRAEVRDAIERHLRNRARPHFFLPQSQPAEGILAEV